MVFTQNYSYLSSLKFSTVFAEHATSVDCIFTESDNGNTAVSKTLVFDTCLMGLIHKKKKISIVHLSVYCICCTRPREVDSNYLI